jgi:gliding motility-associated-like protein
MKQIKQNLTKWICLALVVQGSWYGKELIAQCAGTNLNVGFTYSVSRTCGFPRAITFTNTSTGAAAAITRYRYFINNQLKRTILGTSRVSSTLDTPGTYSLMLIGHDTVNNCFDTVTQSYTLSVSGRARKIKGQNGVYSFKPTWYNCISGASTPDTFGIWIEPEDTLRDYVIIWGDRKANNSGTRLLKTQKIYHRYDSLGVFEIKIAYDNGSCMDTVKGLVGNERQPVAGVIGPPTGTNQGCVPIRIRFINNSTFSSPDTKFTWQMGDGKSYEWPSSKYKDTLFHTYRTNLCNGIVRLTATNTCGSSFTTWNPIQASSKDSAVISLTNPNNCDTTKDFTFNNNSLDRYCLVPDNKKFKWIWGDGTNSGWLNTMGSIKKKYNKLGQYDILLIDSNGCGIDTGRYRLNIIKEPNASFVVDASSGCQPLKVNFRNTSTGDQMNFLWNFNDPYSAPADRTSTLASPTHTFTVGNTKPFPVILRASNKCGFTLDTINVRVYAKANPSFVVNASLGCVPFTVRFTNTTGESFSKGYSYRWSFGDGRTSTSSSPAPITYNSPGTYIVTLYSTDTCGVDSVKQTIRVIGKPKANFSVPALGRCRKDTFLFTNNSSADANQFHWSFGDGSTLQQNSASLATRKAFDSAKTYQVRLIAIVSTGGCRDTITKPVEVYIQPTANFIIDKPAGCGPHTTLFTNSSIHGGSTGTLRNMAFQWDFSSGRTSRAQDTSMHFRAGRWRDTVHTIKMYAVNQWGCRDSVTKTLTVYPNPTARFVLDRYEGCGPLRIATQNFSTPNDTGTIWIMKFRWNFERGLNSSARDTALRLRASATKDTTHFVKLVAISEHGCLDSLTRSVKVYPKPRARFSMDKNNGCRPLTVRFTNSSIPNDTGSIAIMKFTWLFTGRDTTFLLNPSFIFTDRYQRDTIYRVGLVGISEHGCRDTAYQNVTLRPDAYAYFFPDKAQGCGPLPVSFTNQSFNNNRNEWRIDGVTRSLNRNFQYKFLQRPIFDSIYRVTLIVASPFGCRGDTARQDIIVKGDPVASYASNEDTFCFPDKIQFYNQSLNAYRFRWNLGQGTTTSAPNPGVFFPKNPIPSRDTTYNIWLEAMSASGCRDTFTGKMTVLPYPVPDFTLDADKGCSPLSVRFSNRSQNANSYFWDFGNGFSAKSINASHTFYNRGSRDTSYRVLLTTYSRDCTDSVGVSIPVYRPSESYFKFERVNPCDAGYFDFINESFNAATYRWDFNEGSVSSTRDPRHLFPVSPYRDTSYNVELHVTSNRGCVDSFVRVISLPQRLSISVPDTSFIRCIPGEVFFRNATRGAVNYIWDFGDGAGSSVKEPYHQYLRPGVFKYKLTAFDANGCRDSFMSSGSITVGETPEARIDFTPPKGKLPNSTISFLSKSTSTLPLTWYWDFNDPGNPKTSTMRDPYHTFSDSGWYRVMHVSRNPGCTDTAWADVRIDPYLPDPDFTVDIDSGCGPLTVQFTNNTQHADRFIWFFGDGNRSTDRDPKHTYQNAGTYNVTLMGAGPGGESQATKYEYITVLKPPYSLFQVAPDRVFLPRSDFFTKNLTSGAIDYYWDVMRSGRSIASSRRFEPMFKAPDTGWYDVRLISVSAEGCIDTFTLPNAVFVHSNGSLFVPTAFTPNNDTRNDVFKPEYANIQREHYLLRIYDRWGAKMFETTDPDQGWDGLVNGKMQPVGVYVWQVNARIVNGDDVEYHGVVHLMR